MLKSTISIFLILSLSVSPELKKMRTYYVLMSKDENAALALKELAKNSKAVPDNINSAYYAAAEMALAQYKFNPITKLSTFNSGKKGLEAAFAMDSSAIEVRYIRLTIQQNAPSILGYNTSIRKDRDYLIQNLKLIKTSDPDLFRAIYAYLLTRCALNAQEKTSLNS